jgi:hypothetical protein
MSYVRLSPGRKLVIEMLHHAKQVPSIPVAKEINLAPLVGQRAALAERPSWTAIFVRAYGIVCQEFPELRRAYLPYPWAHLYEHPFSCGAVVVERELDGDSILLAAKIRAPEGQTLHDIDGVLQRLKTAPLDKISDFRQLVRFSKAPAFFRRFVFWHSLYWSGKTRAKRFGTFMVSSYGTLGAEQIHPITPLTTLLTFGPIAADGQVVVKIVYDHRVMDGRRVAQALGALERVLQRTILSELAALPLVRASA